MSEEVITDKDLNWFSKLFRKKAKLTYWLDHQAYVCEVCSFVEKSPECIIFADYLTKKNTVVRHKNKITYVLEQIK